MKKARIGLEVHVQLNTDSKLFCSCATQATKPNSSTCEVCLGMPGSRPVANKKAIEFGIKAAISVNCNIEKSILFSRKTYFYPDMSKNYQITQYEKPLGRDGFIEIHGKRINITRIQLEEDPASLKHPEGILHSKYVLVDYNRSGIPLIELVTGPVISSAKEARLFLEELFAILEYLQIFDPTRNTIKIDTNISLPGHSRVEIKNIGSIKDVEKAIVFELVRQETNLMQGIKTKEETRAWTGSATELLREKETDEDYGYIFDPDLPDINITAARVSEIRKSMPELPQQRLQRFKKQYKLNKELAAALVLEKELADDYEKIAKQVEPVFAATWLSKYLKKVLNYYNLRFSQSELSPKELITLLKMIAEEEISSRAGELLLRVLVKHPENPRNLAKRKNLIQIKSKELEIIITRILKANKKAVSDYKAGEKKALQFLVGQVVRKTRGRADAKTVLNLLKHILA